MKTTFERFKNHRGKIILLPLLLLALFTEPCSLYKSGVEFTDNRGRIQTAMFTESNARLFKDVLSYLLERYFAPATTDGQQAYSEKANNPIEKWQGVKRKIIKRHLIANGAKKYEIKSEVGVSNLFTKTTFDKKLAIQENADEEESEKLVNTAPSRPATSVGFDAVGDFDKSKAESGLGNAEQQSSAAGQFKNNGKTVDSDIQKEFTEVEYNTFQLKFSMIGRLKGGICKELACFNSMGKDYNFIKAPNSNRHYFLSNRDSRGSENQFGSIQVYSVMARPGKSRYAPSFYDLKKIEIKNSSGDVLGFDFYIKDGLLTMVFANKKRIYEATSEDGLVFTGAKEIVEMAGALRDPSISDDGRQLAFARETSLKSWAVFSHRNTLDEGFSEKHSVVPEKSLQHGHSGVFTSIISLHEKPYLLFRVHSTLYSAEIRGHRLMPAVAVTGRVPLKYVTGFQGVLISSFMPGKGDYDLGWFKAQAKPVKVKRSEEKVNSQI